MSGLAALAAAADGPGQGLPVVLALVAIGGLVAMLLRVLRVEAGRAHGRPEEPGAPGYAGRARREHPPVTERP